MESPQLPPPDQEKTDKDSSPVCICRDPGPLTKIMEVFVKRPHSQLRTDTWVREWYARTNCPIHGIKEVAPEDVKPDALEPIK
jgi:hypothetical protein